MQLALDADPRLKLIRSYSPRELRIADEVLHESCIVTGTQLIPRWTPTGLAELKAEDLEPIFALDPQLVLLGAGERQQFPSGAIRRAFAQRQIALETMTLGAACRTFNILVQEERRVAAALLLGT